ncbi:MAG: hypothetical protein QOG09_1863 [Solirubrobacterales bacterium]|jgi:hypothetical protein|nr:hypothetical protein [Solirubrobacterales bacterium]MDX6663761.1 hypothetical protein [Solirubrobacterales bacterium]
MELSGNATTILNAAIAGFAVLGGIMATFSGSLAATAYWTGKSREELADSVNEGIALGFTLGAPAAMFALILVGGA